MLKLKDQINWPFVGATKKLQPMLVPIETRKTNRLAIPDQQSAPELVNQKVRASQKLEASWLNFKRVIFGWLLLLMLTPTVSFAQANVGAFQTAVNKIVTAVQQISGIAVVLLIVIGAALLMWGGLSDSWRIRAIRIITTCIVGAAILFLFAAPFAQFIVQTFPPTGAGTTP